jgi:predicted NUDIX family NTP pyrophosphohydrolase
LGEARQKNGKIVAAWAFQGDYDAALLQSNTCEIEWPPKSGKRLEITEIDRGSWFTMNDAHRYIRPDLDDLLLRFMALIERQ